MFVHMQRTTAIDCLLGLPAGTRIAVLSGDLDFAVPWKGTQLWTSELGMQLGLLQDWSPWYLPDAANFGSQVSGG